MYTPSILLLFSLVAALVGYVRTGTADHPVVLLSGLAAISALWILLRAIPARAKRDRSVAAPRKARKTAPPVVVDGSNVMHWGGPAPSLAPVAEVIAALTAQGYRPGVVFDANAGYKLAGRYMDDAPLAKALGLPTDRVLVVPRGKPADPVILESARQLGAPVLSNDRFRDWAADFPEVCTQNRVWRGGYVNGVLWIESERPTARAA